MTAGTAQGSGGTHYWLAQAPYVPGGDTGAADVWANAAVFKPASCDFRTPSPCMLHVHYHGHQAEDQPLASCHLTKALHRTAAGISV